MTLSATLAFYAIWVLVYGVAASVDVRWLALVLGLALVGSTIVRWQREEINGFEKVALYSGAALAIYLSRRSVPDLSRPVLLEYMVFPVMALSLIVCIRSSRERLFKLTPLDILVLVVVVTVPNLPGSVASAQSLGLGVAELVVLFYAIEAMSLASVSRQRWLRASMAVFLFGLVLRAIVSH